MKTRWLAFDVGGANIKVSDGECHALTQAFPLWQKPDELPDQLSILLDASPPCDMLVATMTGELADCYRSKKQGVHAIVNALTEVARGRPVWIYLTDGSLVEAEAAKARCRMAAASNWHAMASFATRFVPSGNAILVDIGSTTCDIIPLLDGEVVAEGRTDTQRLITREMVYTGLERTPICSIVSTVPYRECECSLARENFATTLDAYLILHEIDDRPNDFNTADGQPATREHALTRLARCICADHDEFTEEDAVVLADYVATEQSELLRDAIEAVMHRNNFYDDTKIVLAGHGEPLFSRAANGDGDFEGREVIRLASLIGEAPSRVGPAYALAHIARKVIQPAQS